MALDREFAEAFVEAMARENWHGLLPVAQELPNPLTLEFHRDDISRTLVIHARRITRQARSGASPSTHNRPAGEMHTQMIFDGDQRGAGVRNQLRFIDDAETLLLGFYLTNDDGYVVAAYDPQKHREYAYSKSLQVKWETIEQALKDGIAFQTRQSEETIVAFHLNEIVQYLNFAQEFHSLSDQQAAEIVTSEVSPPDVKRVFRRLLQPESLPELEIEERRREMVEVGRYIRNRQFANAIVSIYERCAICGFQYDDILQAAHIVPVAEQGTDTYDNGLGLCPNCHTMFDKGLILVDETGKIQINLRRAQEYEQLGRAGSLENLKQTLQEFLWLPEDTRYHPSPENLRRTFEARR